MQTLDINGRIAEVDAAPDTPLLWVLRDHLNLTGTKFGCGIASCGACAVHVDGAVVRSCVVPLASVTGKKVRTIEGLAGDRLSDLQQAWVRHQVPQCGYCQSGMLMAASALLARNSAPSDADIDREITNICRCGTYQRIRAAIKDAAGAQKGVDVTAGAALSLALTPALSPSPRPSPQGARVRSAAGAGGTPHPGPLPKGRG